MKTNDREQKEYRENVRVFLEKIVVNAGVGRASNMQNFEDKVLPQISRDIARLTGQKPQTRGAKQSIAGFKIREGQTVGLQVTLRGRRMVDFFERFIRIVLPRVRDFSGISRTSIDDAGVLNIGIREQMVFPEIHPEESPILFSLGVTIVPRGRDKEKAHAMYEALKVPLKKK